MRVALLEDDIDHANLLIQWLTTAGHRVEHFDNSRKFIRQIKNDSYDILILDWLVPEMSGIEVLKWIRENIDWPVPIMFVTAMDREDDIVSGLQAGADDYMIKPIKQRELLARMKAVERRSLSISDDEEIIDLDPFQIDKTNRAIKRDGQAIELTQKEYELALFLFRNQGRVMSRAHILENVWGRNPIINTRTVDTHVSRIRGKLGISPEEGWRLTSIYQHGYRLERVAESTEAVKH